jgi:ubiquitin fusion degradation protein 1
MALMGGGLGGYRRGAPEVFETHYAVFSVAISGRRGIEDGDKILLPPSAFDKLSRMEVDYPMLFELTNEPLNKKTHCGVLEFTAEEGRCYMPFWMMQNLILEEGALIKVKNVALQKAKFVKFRPQSVDFLDISNPRAVLEYTLRKYTCVTTGDMICLPYSGKNYFMEVTEVKPNGAASIIETDCDVDFDPPVGYVDPAIKAKASNAGASSAGTGASSIAAGSDSNVGTAFPARAAQRAKVITEPDTADTVIFSAFTGSAQRLDGKVKATNTTGAAPIAIAGGNAKESVKEVSNPTAQPSAAPTRQSRIGDKFSTKKANASAFSGAGSKLG